MDTSLQRGTKMQKLLFQGEEVEICAGEVVDLVEPISATSATESAVVLMSTDEQKFLAIDLELHRATHEAGDSFERLIALAELYQGIQQTTQPLFQLV